MIQRIGNRPPSRGRRLATDLLLAGGLLAASAGAYAVPFASITPGLTASGQVELSIADSDGNVTQTGQIRTVQGGSTTSRGFTTAPGSNNTTGPTTNPLPGTLTDINDGFGASTDLDGLFKAVPAYQFLADITLDLGNTSAGDTYKVTVKVDYSHAVNAGGNAAFADLELDVELNNVDVITPLQVLSDTLLGDEKDGTVLGTFGAPISDIDMFTFDIVLGPGATGQVTAGWEWEGAVSGDADPRSSKVDGILDLTIDSVMCQSGPGCAAPPAPAPEPGTLALLGFGLAGMAYTRRRRMA